MTVCVHTLGVSNRRIPSTEVTHLLQCALCTEPQSTWAQPSWYILAPFPTCATKGHSAHGSQVDGISLVVREELKPHITYADEQQGTQGEEVACREGAEKL